jgi:hypothetical protein
MTDPVAEFEKYRQELLDQLGDQDPLDVMAYTASKIEQRIKGVEEEVLAARPREGAWSVKEIIGHLGDTEWVYGYRMRMMLSHDAPSIEGYDQDIMVAGMAHNERPISMLLEEHRRPRGLNLDLYRRTKGSAWERHGVHSERGAESVALSVELLAGHDLRHLDQIDRTLAALEG